MRKIAYVGPVDFPDGGAAARRMLGIAQSLRLGGFEVHVGSGALPTARDESIVSDIRISRLSERRAEHLPRVLKHLAYATMGKKTVQWLDTMEPPAAVILYAGYSPYFRQLLPWARRKQVALIFDAVEWYTPQSLIGYLTPYQINIEYAMRILSPQARNVITISSLLERHYTKLGCRTIRVPPTLDTGAVIAGTGSEDHRLVVAYTGTPGHKDCFDAQLEAMLRFDPQGDRTLFRVAGLAESDILSMPALRRRNLHRLPQGIEALGIISGDRARQLVGLADFTVLLRQPNRTSEAGFPTKVVESLTLGTPVIGTATGDLPYYLSDGNNALLCADAEPETLRAALDRAARLDDGARARMRTNARDSAIKNFDFRSFAEPLADFVREAVLVR